MLQTSVERLIKPQNLPFPIGPATFKPSQHAKEFKGGELVSDRYPLVSFNRPPLSKNPLIMTNQDWKMITKQTIKQPDPIEEANKLAEQKKWEMPKTFQKTELQVLKEAYDDAKRETLESEYLDYIRINEEKIEERRQLVQKAWEKLRKQHESYRKLDGALLMSEVIAENDRNIALKSGRKSLEKSYDEKMDQELLESAETYEKYLNEREKQIRQRDRQIQYFQEKQMLEKLVQAKREKEEDIKHLEDVKKIAKDYQDHKHTKRVQRHNQIKKLAKEQQEIKELHEETRKFVLDSSKRDLEKAIRQQTEFDRKNAEYEKMFKQRLFEIEKRQTIAQKWIQENVIPKQVEKLKKDEAKRKEVNDFSEAMHVQKMSLLKNAKDKQTKDIQDSYAKSNDLKKYRNTVEQLSMLEERFQNSKSFENYVEDVNESEQNKFQKQKIFTDFWKEQERVMNEEKAREDALDKERQHVQLVHENKEDIEIMRHADSLVSEQTKAGKNTHALVKTRDDLDLGRLPVARAVDGSGIRIRPKVNLKMLESYSPQNDRNRMSLNWME